VVKRTFLELKSKSLAVDAKPGLRFVASDSALYEMAGDSPVASLAPLEFASLEIPDDNIVLTGLSDDEETESVITSTTDEPHSESTSFTSQDTSRPSSKQQPQSYSLTDPQPTETSSSGGLGLDRLAAENARLAQENLELRQQCLKIASCAQQIGMPTKATPIRCDTPDMLARDPLQSLDSLRTFSLPDAMQSDRMPQMSAISAATTNELPYGMFPANYIWVPMLAPSTSNSPMPAQPTTVTESAHQHPLPMQTTHGKCGARTARAKQVFSKHENAAARASTSNYLHKPGIAPSGKSIYEDIEHGDFDAAAEDCACPEHLRTTVMLRNLPNNYTRAMLLDLIDSEGYARLYDFMYLPIDFNSKACLGYAFVNFTSPSAAQKFRSRFAGFSNWILPSRKVCIVNWSGPHQGVDAHIERYRNSPVMHEAVPDTYKPVLFVDGERVAFPPPTKKIRAPRIRYFRGGSGQGHNFGNSKGSATTLPYTKD
jgi:hypothetical protein